MDILTTNVAASNYQSLAQLGVAVSLAYIVAGPQVRGMLTGYFASVTAFKNLLAAYENADEAQPGLLGRRDPDGEVPKLRHVRALLETAENFFVSEGAKVAPQAPRTAIYYVSAAALFFGVLAYCSVAPQQDTPRFAGVLLAVAVGFVLLFDPTRAAWRGYRLQAIAKAVLQMVYKVGPGPETGLLESSLIEVQLVLMKLLGKNLVGWRKAIQEIKSITKAFDEARALERPSKVFTSQS